MESATDRFRINDFARRSFRDMADGDYILARLAHRNRLIPQFIWNSEQAIEKYLKAILLFHRRPCKDIKHDLRPLIEQVVAIPDLGWMPSRELFKFIDYLDTHNPIRYLEGGYYARGGMLPTLDDAIYEIRRFCAPPEYSQQTGSIEPIQPSPSKKFNLFGGELERIAAGEDDRASIALVWNNSHSGSHTRKDETLSDWCVGVNAPEWDIQLFDLLEPLIHVPIGIRDHFKPKASRTP